jgi:DNA end-binding protein Ku
MARSIWTGTLSFGLVNIPVGLYSATNDKSIHFNQFEAGTSDRIRYKRVNERTGEEVEFSNIVKGYDLGSGEYVLVTDDELEAMAPEKTRVVNIVDFVEQSDIDPIHYRTTYFLAPQGEAARRAYALLREAMRQVGKIGVATFVMRGKEYLVAIRPEEKVLTLETMFFADEVRNPEHELPNLPGEDTFTDRELGTAKLLIDSMEAKWDPEQYRDTYRERVAQLIDEKRQGKEIVTEAPVLQPTKVIDLMEALQASVKAAGNKRAEAPAKPTRSTKKATPAAKAVGAKKAPAKKTVAKKPAAVKATRQRKAS